MTVCTLSGGGALARRWWGVPGLIVVQSLDLVNLVGPLRLERAVVVPMTLNADTNHFTQCVFLRISIMVSRRLFCFLCTSPDGGKMGVNW